jgi:hypothetical protein
MERVGIWRFIQNANIKQEAGLQNKRPMSVTHLSSVGGLVEQMKIALLMSHVGKETTCVSVWIGSQEIFEESQSALAAIEEFKSRLFYGPTPRCFPAAVTILVTGFSVPIPIDAVASDGPELVPPTVVWSVDQMLGISLRAAAQKAAMSGGSLAAVGFTPTTISEAPQPEKLRRKK